MAGIYIHIPFCKQACHYCDFHFSTSLKNKDYLIDSLIRELEIQRTYLSGEIIETIYFGGGTPSLLSAKELENVLNAVYKFYPVINTPEITLEANPEDLNLEKLRQLNTLVNRLSIGIQTFHNPSLKWMNRNHTSEEAISSVLNAKKSGIDNISIDLIYGIETKDQTLWENDLKLAVELDVNHISAYNLTIEPKTVFGKWKRNGTLAEPPDDFSASQFELLINTLALEGFIQYEISNFGKEGWFSKHNSSYWKNITYLGIGPGAHSFNGSSRQSNVSNNTLYIRSLAEGKLNYSIEALSETDRMNEYLLTSLRTIWGIDRERLKSFQEIDFSTFNILVEKYKLSGHLMENDEKVILSAKGKFIADRIISDLFFEE